MVVVGGGDLYMPTRACPSPARPAESSPHAARSPAPYLAAGYLTAASCVCDAHTALQWRRHRIASGPVPGRGLSILGPGRAGPGRAGPGGGPGSPARTPGRRARSPAPYLGPHVCGRAACGQTVQAVCGQAACGQAACD